MVGSDNRRPRRLRRIPRTLIAGGLTATALTTCLTACGGTSGSPAPEASPSGQPSVIAALYPLAFAAAAVAGTTADVSSLATGTVEPHDLELSPQQVADLRAADLVVYIPGLMPTVDDAVSQLRSDQVLDVTSVVTPRGGDSVDPHVWLDPTALAQVGDAISRRLGAMHPADAAALTAGSSALAARLGSLDEEWRHGTTTCARRDLFVTHDAYGYLADRYGLRQIAVLGRNPEQEPSASRLAEVSDLVTTTGATTIFAEPGADPHGGNPVAQTVAAATGVTVDTLDPVEIAPVTGDYVDAMRRNLAAVQQALGCALDPAAPATSSS